MSGEEFEQDADYSRISRALHLLPTECPRHGTKMLRGSTFPRRECCTEGSAAITATAAREALERLDAARSVGGPS